MLCITIDHLKIRGHLLSGRMNLAVPFGRIHLLRGPNGCGKSLLLDTTCGVISLPGINVAISGRRLRCTTAFNRWRAGIRRMFQTPMLPPMVDVVDVLARANQDGNPGTSWVHQVEEFLDACGVRNGSAIGALSFGQRRAVDLVYSLASGTCHLLDEPFAGMRSQAVPFAVALIQSAAARGGSVLVVDHAAESRPDLFDACHDWISSTTVDEFADGRETGAILPCFDIAHRSHNNTTRWVIKHLSIGEKLVASELEILLPPSTVIVCEGGNGTGKSTLLRTLAGVPHPWPGVSEVRHSNMEAGTVLLSPQPPKLIDDISGADNLGFMLGRFGKYPRSLLTDAHQMLRCLGFDVRRLRRQAEVLSGGESAIVALVGAVLSPCPILLLDEPFESFAPAVVPTALRLLERILATGKAVVIVTHDPATIDAVEPASLVTLSSLRPATGRVIGTVWRPRLTPPAAVEGRALRT